MLVWIDTETTGLSPRVDKLLEVAVIITDDDLDEVARYQGVTDEIVNTDLNIVDPFVRTMHATNGLWNTSLVHGQPLKTIEDGVLAVLYEHCYTAALFDPADSPVAVLRDAYMKGAIHKVARKHGPQLAGSTVSFDRAFLEVHMPTLAACLHYRNLDVSSLNEMYKRIAPSVFERRPRAAADGAHRAMGDIESSLEVARFYAQEIRS